MWLVAVINSNKLVLPYYLATFKFQKHCYRQKMGKIWENFNKSHYGSLTIRNSVKNPKHTSHRNHVLYLLHHILTSLLVIPFSLVADILSKGFLSKHFSNIIGFTSFDFKSCSPSLQHVRRSNYSHFPSCWNIMNNPWLHTMSTRWERQISD